MNMAVPSSTPVRLNRHSFLPGDPEQILLHQRPQDKYPTEVTVFEHLYRPMLAKWIDAPLPVPTMNGQLVDVTTHLMCSMCHAWKVDDKFYKDKSRIVRRGRCYYCSDCMDAARLTQREQIAKQRAAKTHRRKKKRKS